MPVAGSTAAAATTVTVRRAAIMSSRRTRASYDNGTAGDNDIVHRTVGDGLPRDGTGTLRLFRAAVRARAALSARVTPRRPRTIRKLSELFSSSSSFSSSSISYYSVDFIKLLFSILNLRTENSPRPLMSISSLARAFRVVRRRRDSMSPAERFKIFTLGTQQLLPLLLPLSPAAVVRVPPPPPSVGDFIFRTRFSKRIGSRRRRRRRRWIDRRNLRRLHRPMHSERRANSSGKKKNF